jgi:tuftelin-interacting protein 11
LKILTLEKFQDFRNKSIPTKKFQENIFRLDMDFAQNTVCPLLTAHLSRWDPLRNPAGPFRDVLRWKDLLPDYYQIILWQCWLPQVRTAIVRWEPRKPDQILEFVATWKSEVSEVIWDNLMNQLIMPKISTAVNSWDPYRETIRIDTWLLPWLPILDKGAVQIL